MYDPRTEVCCNGRPQDMYEDAKTTKCCDKTSYNNKLEICCDGEVRKIKLTLN